MDDWRGSGFGLYLHWPFCQSKCPYCDFNSHVASIVDQTVWQDAFLREIDRLGRQTEGRVLNSVFFGGGTPSLMDQGLVAAVLDRIRSTWPMANDLEVTLEANPTSVEMGRFRGYAEAGVNRVSLGIQALDDGDLRRLGRMHSSADAHRAIEIAQTVFARVSIDLIYARQNQTIEAWTAELQSALSLGTDHISLYQLTVEDGTVFGDLHKRKMLRGLPGEDLGADLFERTRELCRDAGFSAYEVSNHARPGAESRHNLIYWRMGDYIGIGPGAHGRLTLGSRRFATESERMPARWLDQVMSGQGGEHPRQTLDLQEQAVEYLMMSLRLKEGSSLARYRSLAGADLPKEGVQHLLDLQLVTTDGDTIKATERGTMMLNGVLRALLNDQQAVAH